MFRNNKLGCLKSCLGLLVGIPLLLISMLLIARGCTQSRLRSDAEITTLAGIQSQEQVILGGVEQSILIRGEDSTKPVLLWLHGGPGSAQMPFAAKHDSELIKSFVVVHWDQRGAGKSFSADLPESSINVEQFLADTIELTEMLTERFDTEKVYLVGHSWGSTLGMRAIHKRPDLYKVFVGIGQSVSAEGDTIGYQWAIEQAQAQGNQPALDALEGIGAPPWTTVQEFSVFSRWIDPLGGTGSNTPSVSDFLLDIATSPDYALRDVFQFLRGQLFSATAFLDNSEIGDIDLFEQVQSVDVPVHFFQGRYDYNTPGELAERYYNFVEAPEKSFVWFEESAHFPYWEEPEKFMTELLAVLK